MAGGFVSRCGWRSAVAVAVVLGVVSVSGCGGKGKPPAPHAGQAVLLPRFAQDSRIGRALSDPLSPPLGFSTAANGDSYLLNSPTLVRLRADGQAVDVPAGGDEFGDSTPAGVVAMPDRSVLLGHDGQVVRLDRQGHRSVVAGKTDSQRASEAAAPARATAADVRFTDEVAPLGVTRSGAVMIADGRALWSLRSGQLTRVYQRPPGSRGKDATISSQGDAVAPDGTVYLRPAAGGPDTLAHVQVISPDGGSAAPTLPTSLPGVAGPLATLTPSWMASDGAGGVYVHALRLRPGPGDYVLHLRDGKATVVAVGGGSGAAIGASCAITEPVDAEHFPCPLPTALGYHAGRLVLAGAQPYAVKVVVGGR